MVDREEKTIDEDLSVITKWFRQHAGRISICYVGAYVIAAVIIAVIAY